jgi:hypothetical protein
VLCHLCEKLVPLHVYNILLVVSDKVMFKFGAWLSKETFAAESDAEAIFDADAIVNNSNLKNWQNGVALWCGNRMVKQY